MSTQTANTKRIPNPVYAAAGAGDLAYRQLRKLPAKVAELRGKVTELRPVILEAVREPKLRADVDRLRADVDRLRSAARRNAANLRVGAQSAQQRAAAVYGDLVARGERVVGGPYKQLPPAGDVVDIQETPDVAPAQTATPAAASGPGRRAKKATS
jgi:heparin binding hemagglutinin HbhA